LLRRPCRPLEYAARPDQGIQAKMAMSSGRKSDLGAGGRHVFERCGIRAVSGKASESRPDRSTGWWPEGDAVLFAC